MTARLLCLRDATNLFLARIESLTMNVVAPSPMSHCPVHQAVRTIAPMTRVYATTATARKVPPSRWAAGDAADQDDGRHEREHPDGEPPRGGPAEGEERADVAEVAEQETGQPAEERPVTVAEEEDVPGQTQHEAEQQPPPRGVVAGTADEREPDQGEQRDRLGDHRGAPVLRRDRPPVDEGGEGEDRAGECIPQNRGHRRESARSASARSTP